MSLIMVYRIRNIKIYLLISLIFFFSVINLVLVIVTTASYFFDSEIFTFEFIAYFSLYPLATFIAPTLNLIWVINLNFIKIFQMFKNWQNIGKVYLIFSFNAIINHMVLLLFRIYDIFSLDLNNNKTYSEGKNINNYFIFNVAKILLLPTSFILNYLGTIYLT